MTHFSASVPLAFLGWSKPVFFCAWVACIAVAIFPCSVLGVTIQPRALACSNHTNCNDCRSNGCAWATMQDCTLKCLDVVLTTIPRNTPWRSRVVASENVLGCSVLDVVKNPSWEDLSPLQWTQELDGMVSARCDSTCTVQKPGLTAFDGTFFVWFGGYQNDLKARLSQTVTLPTSATHLSFYAYVGALDSTTKTGIDVYVDMNMLFRLDKYNWDMFAGSYHVMELDIRKYADGFTHQIVFDYVGRYSTATTVVSSIQLDLIQVIQCKRIGNTPYKFTPVTTCSTGCPLDYLNDNECDKSCNNAQCTFDNGKCEAPVTSTPRCYDSQVPVARTLPKCQWYDPSTCCISYDTISFVELQINRARNTTNKCAITDKCLSAIDYLLCAKCSPNNQHFFKGGKLQVCLKYAMSAWNDCQQSFLPDGNGGCQTMSSVYKDVTDWLSKYGAILAMAETDCFNLEDITPGKKPGMPTSTIIAIAVGVSAGVIILISIATAVWWFKFRHPKPSNDPSKLDSVNAANVVTMVPVELVQQDMGVAAGMAGNGVVYTDQFGNIISQDQLVVVDDTGMGSPVAGGMMSGGMQVSGGMQTTVAYM